MNFIFLQQAAGGPTGWGQRGPVGPRGLKMQKFGIDDVEVHVRNK